MKGYFKAAASAIIGVVLFFGMTLSSCSDVDDTLGLNLIPGDQEMVVLVDTIRGVDTYVSQTDSIPTSNIRRMIIGNYQSDMFGTSKYSGLYEFLPFFEETYSEKMYGNDPVFDSVFLVLYINEIWGDPSVSQDFYIYPLKDTITYDSNYLATYPYGVDGPHGEPGEGHDKVDFTRPLFKFTLHNETKGTTPKLLSIVDPDSVAVKELMNTLMNINYKEVMEDEDEYAFHKLVHGFYIAPADDAPQKAAVYDIITSDYLYHYTELFVYAHEASAVPDNDGNVDVQIGEYHFDDYYSLARRNSGINVVKHDYTGSPVGNVTFNDTLPGTQPLDVIYVQSVMGPCGYLRFTDEFVDRLHDLMTHEGERYTSLYVNRAMLYIYLDDASYLAKDVAPGRLGLYYTFNNAAPWNIPDYPYLLEASTSYISKFGGYLNRSKNRYEMDISTYVRLLATDDATQRELWLAPAIDHIYMAAGASIKGAGSDQPIELALTYTLIK